MIQKMVILQFLKTSSTGNNQKSKRATSRSFTGGQISTSFRDISFYHSSNFSQRTSREHQKLPKTLKKIQEHISCFFTSSLVLCYSETKGFRHLLVKPSYDSPKLFVPTRHVTSILTWSQLVSISVNKLFKNNIVTSVLQFFYAET